MIKYLLKYDKMLIAFSLSIWAMMIRFNQYAPPIVASDEIYQYGSYQGPLKHFWLRVNYGDLSSFPGEYLLTWFFVQRFDSQSWEVVIPHILLTILGFYILYLICQRYLTTGFGFGITFAIVALNSTMIFHAFRLRPYAAFPTLALLAFYFWDALLLRNKVYSIYQKLGIALLFIVIFVFNVYGLFMVGLPLLFCLLIQLTKQPINKVMAQFPKFMIFTLIVGGCLWLWYASGDPQHRSGGFLPKDHSHHTFYFIHNPLVDPLGFMRSMGGNLIGNSYLYVLVLGVLGIFVTPPKERFKQVLFFLVLVVMPLVLMCTASILKSYYFLQRQFIWVMPFFALFLGCQWENLLKFFLRGIPSRR